MGEDEPAKVVGVVVDNAKPFVVVQFDGDGSADAAFHISGEISELMLFGVSEMLKQFAYDQMAEKTMRRQMEEARAGSKKPQLLVPSDHLGPGGLKRN